ncbi:D-3-phosphoglycerate dehydrogenase / 2-oxoglutarate reductase [Phycisphaerales bacterium]|nr:D-3-phosphoglycerate dehydrogenase / 2-oxoglutarate reductase [Phycisphaerales bacterium]
MDRGAFFSIAIRQTRYIQCDLAWAIRSDLVKVIVADKFERVGLEGLAGLGFEVLSQPGIGTDELAKHLASQNAEVLVVRSTKVPASVIEKSGSLRLIVRAGAGVDNIDVGAATAKGIKVCNCPGMNAVAVAELAMGLLLCCDRRIPDQTFELRAGRWNKKEFGKTGAAGARGLKGMTLGVVGVGAIGQEVIRRATAFGMQVVAWSRGITPQHAAALNAEFGGTDTPALLALANRSDAISVHLPLADTTKKLFNKTFFDAMKPGAYFVNTSRGGIVDEAALREAIQTKGIRAGLDVYEFQPSEAEAGFESPTPKLPGVYGTHHSGASTEQAQLAVAHETVRIVKVFHETGRFENCVNA